MVYGQNDRIHKVIYVVFSFYLLSIEEIIMILQFDPDDVPMLVTLTILLVGITFGMLAWLIHKMNNEIKRLTEAVGDEPKKEEPVLEPVAPAEPKPFSPPPVEPAPPPEQPEPPAEQF